MCRSQPHGKMTGSCSHLFQELNFFKRWSLDWVQGQDETRPNNVKSERRKAAQHEDQETSVMKKDPFQGSGLQQSLRLAETKQEELLSSCSQITTTCFLLLSHWFYLYRARTLARATPTQTHTHSQVSSTRCLWQLILYMLFPWEHSRQVFSASVMKAVGFWEADSVGESCGVKLFRIVFIFSH